MITNYKIFEGKFKRSKIEKTFVKFNIDLIKESYKSNDYYINTDLYLTYTDITNNKKDEIIKIREDIKKTLKIKYKQYIKTNNNNNEIFVFLTKEQAIYLNYFLIYKRKFSVRKTEDYHTKAINRYEFNKTFKIFELIEFINFLPVDFEQNTIDYYLVNLVLHNKLSKAEIMEIYDVISLEAKERISHLVNASNFDLI